MTTHSMTSASAGPTPFPNIENGFPTATSCVTTDSAPTAPMTTSENRNSLLTHYGGVTSSGEGRTATQVLYFVEFSKREAVNDAFPLRFQEELHEIQSLKREVFVLRRELQQCKATIAKLNSDKDELAAKQKYCCTLKAGI